MFEQVPANKPRSTLQGVLGFLLGLLISLGCLFVAVFVGMSLRLQSAWLMPVLNAVALVAAGGVALRMSKESSYAQGALIAFALVFLLNGACGVAYFH